MKAVILAAGKGTRLGSLTADTPKCLVTINGKPILDYQLEALQAAGVEEIYVVAGYHAEQVQAFAGGRYETLINERFETTNSIYSLWLARDKVGSDDFLLLNGDVVAQSSLVEELASCSAPCAALIDNKKSLTDGEMNVVIRTGRICGFSKAIRAVDADGESAQITRFGKREARLLFRRIEELIDEGGLQCFPAQAYDVIFAQSAMLPIYTGNRWHFEIDTPQDYATCSQFMEQLEQQAAHN